jgi:hypothetical protein
VENGNPRKLEAATHPPRCSQRRADKALKRSLSRAEPKVRIHSPPAESPCLAGFRPPTSKTELTVTGDRKFESVSLQRGVCKLSVPREAPALTPARRIPAAFRGTGRIAYQQRVRCEPASDGRRWFHKVTLNYVIYSPRISRVNSAYLRHILIPPHQRFQSPSREDANHVLHYTSEQVRQNNHRMV